MADLYERSLIVHEQLRGKIGVVNKMPIIGRDDLSLAYTPGVAWRWRRRINHERGTGVPPGDHRRDAGATNEIITRRNP